MNFVMPWWGWVLIAFLIGGWLALVLGFCWLLKHSDWPDDPANMIQDPRQQPGEKK